MEIRIEHTKDAVVRVDPLDPARLGFGRQFVPHMFRAAHDAGKGWHDAAIVPRESLAVDPAASVLQYGQAVFEGLKAFAWADGSVHVFRPDMHARRLVESARRLCLPELLPEDFLSAVSALVATDRDSVPRAADSSLYLRPVIVGTEAFLGVRPSATAELFVIGSPVGAYFHGGRRPLRLWVETVFSRAAPGGTGAIKCGGNYAASLLAAERARAHGFDQVLWTDARTHTTIEEAGTMNVFVRLGDTVVTPRLDGTILPGVTRDSVLTLLREWNVRVEERSIATAEIANAVTWGTSLEMFGTGTAALVAPIGELAIDGQTLRIDDGHEGPLTKRLDEAIRAIQSGNAEDTHHWLVRVP